MFSLRVAVALRGPSMLPYRFISTFKKKPNHKFQKPKVVEPSDGLQFNEHIPASKVLLIDDKTKVGEMSLFDAIAHARTTGRDVLAVSGGDKPGSVRVCKVVRFMFCFMLFFASLKTNNKNKQTNRTQTNKIDSIFAF